MQEINSEYTLEAIDLLGWTVTLSEKNKVTASVPISFKSWGEKLTILIKANSVEVTSRCVFPTQCLDWGKNKENARRLIAHFKLLNKYTSSR